MKVFLDANILYSASGSGSLMERFVLRLLRKAKCCTNTHAMEEARRNLEANEPSCLANFSALLSRIGVLREHVVVEEARLPEKDRPILGGAVAGRCTHLLTSDRRDFGRFFGTTIRGVKVVSPQLMAEEIGLKPTRRGEP
jgi:hypothetical protein